MTIKGTVKKFTPKFLLNIYHYKLSLLGAVIFGFPGKSKKIKIIGVTGTSGKTTTVNLICSILEEAGYKIASFSTVRFKIGNREWKNELKMTMPGRTKVQKFLRQAIEEKCQFAVLEVSSEGIRQFRHKFINFDAAVFTNLTPEHIESHGGFENYRNEKLKLFRLTKNIHIINTDDKNSNYFWEIPARQKIGFSSNDKENNKFNFNLMGDFNVMNALAAIFVARTYGINFEICKRALERAKTVPGRMEIVQKEPFLVVVDYAHTPEQLESVYKTLQKTKNREQKSALICVLGSCGGGRDKWKRPELGKIAEKYCDKIIITNEDPYDESPMEIINQIATGTGSKAEKILDRKEAIKKSLELAKTSDTVIITGKGSEPWMCVENGKKISWDDRKTVKTFLENK
jgi:UDP-N-acetylmuramoyl-L-alanyl-D-glutamate--2,6-diaminopimelate ligase